MADQAEELIRQIERGMLRAVLKAGEETLTDAAETVPYKEGILQGTGFVDGEYNSSTKTAIARIGYDTPYALRLHEHPEYNFRNGRRGLWLKLTLDEEGERYKALMESEISKLLR